MDLRERPSSGSEEARHPWERARALFFRRVLTPHLRPGDRVLDVGAGDAWFAQQLVANAPVSIEMTCWDEGYGAAAIGALGRSPGPRVVLTDKRPTGQFDVLIMLDVLEHVANDGEFIQEIVTSSLVPHGTVVVSLPAWRRLYSDHDRRLRHVRRYDPADARALLEGAGLEVEHCGGLFHCLLPLRAAEVLRERGLRAANGTRATAEDSPPPLEWRGSPRVAQALELALATEGRLSLWAARRRWSVPGLSWWALCHRR